MRKSKGGRSICGGVGEEEDKKKGGERETNRKELD